MGREPHHRDPAEGGWWWVGESFMDMLLCSLGSWSLLLESQDFGGLAVVAATQEAVCQLATVVLLPLAQPQNEGQSSEHMEPPLLHKTDLELYGRPRSLRTLCMTEPCHIHVHSLPVGDESVAAPISLWQQQFWKIILHDLLLSGWAGDPNSGSTDSQEAIGTCSDDLLETGIRLKLHINFPSLC